MMYVITSYICIIIMMINYNNYPFIHISVSVMK